MSPTLLPLVFEAPRRGKPPKHWFDLSREERVEAATNLGLPRFRADQISRHVFDRLEDDATAFTDLQTLLDAQRKGDGFATYDELSEDQVKELSDAVNALSEPLSKIAGVILA